MSQCSNVYQHMLDQGPITPLMAFQLYGILALHSRISELRERLRRKGVEIEIETTMIEVNGKRVGQYSIPLRVAYG